MRSTLLILLFASACASAPGHRTVNIPATRHQIDDAIAADPGLTRVTGDFAYQPAMPGARPLDTAEARHLLAPWRRIASVGRVTEDRAVVYTAASGPGRLEETWVREPDGWKLGRVVQLGTATGGTSTSAAR
jgi:hypothetical protein